MGIHKISGRQSDERILQMLHLRTSGLTSVEIGERIGIHSGQVLRDINRVVAEDMASDPNGGDFLDAYPWMQKKQRDL